MDLTHLDYLWGDAVVFILGIILTYMIASGVI